MELAHTRAAVHFKKKIKALLGKDSSNFLAIILAHEEKATHRTAFCKHLQIQVLFKVVLLSRSWFDWFVNVTAVF